MSQQLPSDRVFLIRLSGKAEPAAGKHHGRIEHIRTGRIARFTSLDNLEQFISEVLTTQNESTGPEEPPGWPTTTSDNTLK